MLGADRWSRWRLSPAQLREINRRSWVWLGVIVLLLFSISIGLIATSEVALQYWYLLSVPLLLAAFRFGERGATIVAIISMLILTAVFQSADKTFDQATGFLQRLISVATTPDEARQIALQLADLRAADPQTNFARAVLGLFLVCISSILLGSSVDNRARATDLLQRAFNKLRRYFSPQIIETIIAQNDDGDLYITSSRKEITLLFADLRGFTALSERMEPEEIARMLNEFFSAMTDEIFREDGTLDKYLGDGVMAFFGDPVAHPDHAERAFRAAIAMQKRMQELQAFWDSQGRESTGMGIGISTGHAIVGNTGSPTRMEYTAIGSTVNIAARLADIAGAGQTLTTRKTYRRVQHVVDGQPRAPATVKGFTHPVEIVEIMGARLVRREEETSMDQRVLQIVSRVVNDPAYRAMLLSSSEEAFAADFRTDEERRLARQVAVLSGYPIFQGVPAREIAVLMDAVSVEQHSAGTVIVQQGATADKFYIILQGDAIVTVASEDQRERHIASLARGDYFGEAALLFDTPRIATVRAGADCTLLVLGPESFYQVLALAPTLRSKIESMSRTRLNQSFPARQREVSTTEATYLELPPVTMH